MKSAVDVDDAEVQKMVEESVEHAWDDLHARQWIEARLRAQETLAATQRALAECGGQISPDYRTEVEQALKSVADLLAGEDAGTHPGDAAKLTSELARLDQATQPLADLMMDKAMETVLRKRGLV